MQAVIQQRYGSPDVLTLCALDTPAPGPGEVLVAVAASPVTYGDRRLRAADFPGITAIPGRLMMGVFGPRRRVPGTVFAGRVAAVGEGVTRFAVGDDVFGGCDAGAHAEYVVVAADGAIAPIPAGVSHAEAAAVPYGALTALVFLTEFGGVTAGEQVLIIGAGGGVGQYAVQVARHLGAEVTAVCHPRDFDRMRALGAQHVIDYTAEDFTRGAKRYDVVFDTPGVMSFGRCKRALTPTGRFVTLHVSLGVLWSLLTAPLVGRRRVKTGVSMSTQARMARVAELLATGAIRPQLGARLPFGQIAEAHAASAAGRTGGTVVVTITAAAPALRLAA